MNDEPGRRRFDLRERESASQVADALRSQASPRSPVWATEPRCCVPAYFGGGSGYLGRLRELVHQRTITLDLAAGEGYVLINDWWLHGRRRFVGDRTMLRLIGDPLPEHRIAPGFLPVGAEISVPVGEPTS